jgi:putative transposase
MTSKPRIIVPNRFYHIHSLCSPVLNIFKSTEMKQFFFKQLSITLQKFSYDCLAWSLLDDHYHLIIKSADHLLPLFMQRFNSILAKEFNKINHSFGSVFAKRYSSIVVQDGCALNEIIRYVHLNPVRKGICTIEELDNYQWTGHHSIVNNTPASIINVGELLAQFGNSDPLTKYKNFIKKGTHEPDNLKLVRMSNRGNLNFHKSNCFIIGDKDFTGKVLAEDQCRKARIARYIKENVTLDKMLEKVRICVDIDHEDIFRQGNLNEISTARQLFAIIGHCHFEFKCIDIARYLNITGSAVSSMISRRKRIAELDFLKRMICT